jgi:hypothetical protein
MAADLAGPGYHINRSNLLVLESKTDMQKRGQGLARRRRCAGADLCAARGTGGGRRRGRRGRVRRVWRSQQFWRVDAMTPAGRDPTTLGMINAERTVIGDRHGRGGTDG